MMERVLRKIVSAEALGLILVLIALQAFVFGISGSLRSSDERQTAYFYWMGLCAVFLALIKQTKLKRVLHIGRPDRDRFSRRLGSGRKTRPASAQSQQRNHPSSSRGVLIAQLLR